MCLVKYSTPELLFFKLSPPAVVIYLIFVLFFDYMGRLWICHSGCSSHFLGLQLLKMLLSKIKMKKKTPNFTSVARNSPLPNRPEADGALILLEICQLIKLQKISLH